MIRNINKKGQALVEFVAIIPVFLMLVFCIFDFARLISLKGNLESKLSDAVGLYENGKTKEEIEKIIDEKNLIIQNNDNYIEISIKDKIAPITPGLNNISKNMFEVQVKRKIDSNIFIISTTSESGDILDEDEQ